MDNLELEHIAAANNSREAENVTSDIWLDPEDGDNLDLQVPHETRDHAMPATPKVLFNTDKISDFVTMLN